MVDIAPPPQLPRPLSPPADTIRDCLETAGWTQADLAERMGRTKKHVQDLIKNKTRITSDTAVELSRTLGGSVQFWLNLEANYQAALAERESLKRHEGDRPWLKELPVAVMRAEAHARGLPFLDVAGRLLVRRAISNARRNA